MFDVPQEALSLRVRTTCDQLQARIRHLPAGMPLPTMPELRRELSVSQVTLERAYEQLEARGLIWRKKGKGVFVADRLQTGEFAIVLRPALLGSDASPYYRTVSSHVIRLLHDHNPRWQVRMHVGQHTATGPEFPPTLDLLDPDVLPRLRGVVSFHRLGAIGESLERAGVPITYIGEFAGHTCAAFDQHGDFLREAMRHLRDAGCRSIGSVIYSRPLNGRFIQAFIAHASSVGLACRPEWLDQTDTCASERTGYEGFVRLWSREPRPDAILMGDDVMCNGALRATLRLGLRMPRNLRLVTFVSRGIDLAYHLPVSRVEYDMQELAERVVELMLRRVRGENVTREAVLLTGRMIKGSTS